MWQTKLTKNIILLFTFVTAHIFFLANNSIASGAFPNPHGNYSADTIMCDKCHSGHSGLYGGILDAVTQRQTCYSCHDGSASNFNVRAQFGETTIGSSVYASYHPAPTGQQLCTTCHEPHFDPVAKPRILSVGEQAYSSGKAVCGACHGSGSSLPGGDMIAPFTGTAHDAEINNPSSGTQIKCARCHGPHGSPYNDIIRTTIEDVYGTPRAVTGNNNTVCFGCHTDKTGNYFGKLIYEQTQHGPGTSTVSETTYAEFSLGTRSGTTAISSGDLTLIGDAGLKFDGVDDRVYHSYSYTAIQNSFTYEFWAKPLATHQIDVQSSSSTTGTGGQKYAIGAQFGPSGSLAGAGVSIGTNGISVYEHASGYMPPLLVYSGSLNGWVHVAVVYDNKKPHLYVNGELKKIGFTSPKTPFPSNTFGYGTYGYFNGSLDDIRIWNYARSQSQIKSDMYKQLAGTETGLVGYWKLNEGSGTVATDSTGANNATIAGALWNQYGSSGYRISPELSLPAVTAVGSQIKWNSTLPSSTALTVQTNLFLNSAWQGWKTIANGDPIPGITNGTNLTGAKIQYRVDMSASDTSVSPRLQDVNFRITHNSTKSKSTYPGTSYPASDCMNCHEPHGKTGVSFYRRADGNTLCTNCHDDGSVTDNYSYQEIAKYNATPHSAMGPIPNPQLYTNPAMTNGYCVICHNPHGKTDGSGIAIPKQLQLAQDQLCFGGGSGCHSDAANSTLGVNIQNRFTAGSNDTARHSVSLSEQTTQNTKIKCANCHNPHINTATNKIVDPTNPDTFYTTFDTSLLNYVSDTGEVYMLAKAKHDGTPPTFTSGPTVSSMTDTSCVISWGTNEVTTGVVEWGTTTALGNTINSSAKTYHSVTLSGLTLFQNYYYRVKATDAMGNFTYSPITLVDSIPPTITSGPTPVNPGATSLYINWNTDEVSNSWVDYNTSVDYAVYGFADPAGNNTLTTAHSVYLDNLKPATEYTYQVRSKDRRGNERTSATKIFMVSTPPPAPVLVPEEDHVNYSYTFTATLYWNSVTDLDGDSVQYYTEISTSSTFSSNVTNSGWISGTNWNVSLSNYNSVTYYWRVKARDQWGFESGWSAVDSFIHDGGSAPKWDSCPFVYGWNGTEFEYISDMSGAVINLPITTKVDPNKFLPYYLPGNNLVPDKNNQYMLKIRSTAPGEVDILDQIGLILVDHAPGYEIISSSAEGYGQFMKGENPRELYAISNNALRVKKAIGKHGKDVTKELLKQDNIPAPAERKNFAEADSFILDFGRLNHPEYAKLVLDGWTYYRKDIKLQPQDIPRVEVINVAGQWEKVRDIGFITGDKKSMMIDLSGAFKTDDHRVRIFISERQRRFILDSARMDQSPPIPLKTTYVSASDAHLYFRGPSNQIGNNFDNPVLVKDDVKSGKTNLIFYGNFTKYGNVTPLLEKTDDMFVIMQHGDDVLITFDNPPLEKGLQRSAVIYADYYYKQTGKAAFDPTVRLPVEPLPFHKMSRYPYPASEKYPNDKAHNDYIKEWLTREYKLIDGEVVLVTPLFHANEFINGLWKEVPMFLDWLLNSIVEKTASDTEPPFLSDKAGSGEGPTNPADSDTRVLIANFQNHYSINTDYVALRADDTINSTLYTINSVGSGMWQSDTEPTPSSPGADSIAEKAKVTSSDNNRWATEMYLPNEGEGRFNYQMFKFAITNPARPKMYSLKVFWEGYGEPTSGYNVSLSLWNFAQSRWDVFYDQLVSSERTFALQKTKDYKDYCLKCHGGTVPSGVQLGPYTRNISTTYATDYHGGTSGTDDSGSTIKPTYSRGISVPCADCHDLHGSQNAYHLRENVNGATGLNLPSMEATSKYDTSKNAATLAYCQSCHAGTLDSFHMAKCLSCHRGIPYYDHYGWYNTSPQAGDFGRACTYCHTHGGYYPAHGVCHCTLDHNAKAF